MANYYTHIKRQIRNNEITETRAEDEVICPWCGEIYPAEDDSNLLEDGQHKCQCMECGKDFNVDVGIVFMFSTTREGE